MLALFRHEETRRRGTTTAPPEIERGDRRRQAHGQGRYLRRPTARIFFLRRRFSLILRSVLYSASCFVLLVLVFFLHRRDTPRRVGPVRNPSTLADASDATGHQVSPWNPPRQLLGGYGAFYFGNVRLPDGGGGVDSPLSAGSGGNTRPDFSRNIRSNHRDGYGDRRPCQKSLPFRQPLRRHPATAARLSSSQSSAQPPSGAFSVAPT